MIRHARMRGHRALFLPGLDHASIAAQFVLDGILAKEGESRQSLGRERYLERMRAFVATTREVMLGQQRRVGGVGRLGPPALHDGRGLGQGRPRRLRAALRGGPRLPHRGARQLVPGLPDERQRPRGRRHAGDRDALVRPLPPDRRGDRRSPTRTPRSPSRPPAPRRSSATPRSRSIPTMRATPASSGASCASRSSSATCRSSPTTSSTAAFGTGAVKITPAHDHDDHATGLRHGLPALDHPRRRRDDHRRPGRATTAWTATRPARPIVADLEARGDLVVGDARTRWSSAAASAATTSSSRGSRPSGSSGPGRSPRARSRRPASGRTRILPERFEKTWEHWLTNIRDWNVSRQLWWGHRIPAWYCPDGHVTVSSEPDGPGRLRGLRPARRGAPAGPGHLRHLVQLRAVAVLDPRLAGRHAGPRDLLPDVGHGDRLRHHLLLGRPDDDARASS